MKKFIYILVSIILCSCVSNVTVLTDYVNVNEDCPKDSFFSDYSYIRLGKSEPMISQVNDLRMNNDKLFILDKTSKVFIFSTNGEFFNVIDKRGHGSSEYITVSDYDVKDGFIYILSRPQKKVFTYTYKGEHINTYVLNDYYNGLRVMSNDRLCLASENSNDQKYNFVIYDIKKRSYTARFSPFSKNESMLFSSSHPFLGRNNDTLYVCNPFSTEVIEIKGQKSGKTKEYSFNTQEQLPDNISDYTFEQLQKKYTNKPVVKSLSLYCKTSRYEYIGYKLFGKYGLSFFLTKIKENGTTETMMSLNDINKKFPYVSSSYDVVGNKIISSMPASSIITIEKEYHLSKFKSLGIKDDDNPVVFLHTLK